MSDRVRWKITFCRAYAQNETLEFYAKDFKEAAQKYRVALILSDIPEDVEVIRLEKV